MKFPRTRIVALCSAALLAFSAGFVLVGCRGHMPHAATWPATGDVVQSHPEPPEGGYYSNWDPYAATLEVKPSEAVNPVKTQHVLIATVLDHEGRPLPNRRIEWIISEGSVGDFVEVDESGWRASRGYKITNHFAVTHTNNFPHLLDRGTDDPSDDIQLTEGQSWVVITSPVEGTTHATVYVPGIYDWNKHKVFVTKHWYDVGWEWPPPATNRIGTPHRLSTRVFKLSDGMPLEGYIITYKLLGGPAATFDGKPARTVSVETDAAGIGAVTLEQVNPVAGQNEIRVDIIRPDDRECCRPGSHIAAGHTSKVWLAPSIAINKEAPPRGEVGKAFPYTITVSNPANVEARDVIVTDVLPLGLKVVGGTPRAELHGQTMTWSLGSLSPKTRVSISATVKASQTGNFMNCAEVAAADGLSDRDCANTIISAPQLAIEMQCLPQAVLCDLLPYRVLVRNIGDGAARNVVIQVKLPSGLATEDGMTDPAFDAGTLAPGQAKDATFNVKPYSTGLFVAHATAGGQGGLFAEAHCQTEVGQPVLTVTKVGPAKRYIGRPATYQITVANEGDLSARDTVVVDTLPAGVQFVQASQGGQYAGQKEKVTWRLGTLAPGTSTTMTLTLQSARLGVMHNQVVAKAYCAEATAATTTSVEGIPAILLEVVDIDDPIEVGNTSSYEIIVTNQGSMAGTNIEVTCTLPPEEEYVSASGPTAAGVQGKMIVFSPLPSLPPQSRATYRIIIRGTAPGDVRFRVSLTSDQAQVPIEETESTHIY